MPDPGDKGRDGYRQGQLWARTVKSRTLPCPGESKAWVPTKEVHRYGQRHIQSLDTLDYKQDSLSSIHHMGSLDYKEDSLSSTHHRATWTINGHSL